MVKLMSNRKVLEKVNEKLKLDNSSLSIFSNIVNDIPVVGKRNKEKMIKRFMNELKVDESTAAYYYETFKEIITNIIKDKLKHPFRKN
mgnify:CR=1 FL=1